MNLSRAFREIAVACSAQQCRVDIETAMARHLVRRATINMLDMVGGTFPSAGGAGFATGGPVGYRPKLEQPL